MDYSNVTPEFSSLTPEQQLYYQQYWAGMHFDTPKPSYGGFWIRVGAYCLDLILLVIVQLIIWQAVDGQAMELLINALFGWLYFAGLEAAMGGTPGKLVLGLRVTGMSGDNISFLRATGRYFAKIVSGLILGIGFFMVGWTERKQGLHDMMTDTLVVKGQ